MRVILSYFENFPDILRIDMHLNEHLRLHWDMDLYHGIYLLLHITSILGLRRTLHLIDLFHFSKVGMQIPLVLMQALLVALFSRVQTDIISMSREQFGTVRVGLLSSKQFHVPNCLNIPT